MASAKRNDRPTPYWRVRTPAHRKRKVADGMAGRSWIRSGFQVYFLHARPSDGSVHQPAVKGGMRFLKPKVRTVKQRIIAAIVRCPVLHPRSEKIVFVPAPTRAVLPGCESHLAELLEIARIAVQPILTRKLPVQLIACFATRLLYTNCGGISSYGSYIWGLSGAGSWVGSRSSWIGI